MSPLKVACPRCQAALAATQPFPPDLRVRCGHCGTVFPLAGATGVSSRSTSVRPSPVPVAVGISPPPAHPEVAEVTGISWASVVVAISAVVLVAGGGTTWIVMRGGRLNEAGAPAEHSRVEDVRGTANEPRAALPASTAAAIEPGKSTQSTAEPVANNRLRADRWAESPSGLPIAQRQAINQAIERGIAYLKRKQGGTGGWPSNDHAIGYAALPGLTLLECGVPASDPAVQKGAAFVRERMADLTGTYELALAVLFLERLGDASDRSLVQELALRLVAGQLPDGGWSYPCRVLDGAEQEALLSRLEQLRPASTSNLFKSLIEATTDEKPTPSAPRKNRDRPRNGATLENVPALQENLEVRQDFRGPMADNSNTQFALLALWAAQRQGVPVERSLALVVQRFRPSQNDDGGWGYHSGGAKRDSSKPSMTCVGLLGLAVGHGLGGNDSAARGSVSDPQIEKALRYLAKRIGKPGGDKKPRAEDLYFLWSLERVGVLYGLNEIEGRDWYAWGANGLLAHQGKEGNWQNGRYHGSTPTLDTCFALLFLKRANLVHDLTKKIEFLKIELRAQE